ncbi:MAG: hypothetical protein V3V22_06350 [Methylococcales bacterium]
MKQCIMHGKLGLLHVACILQNLTLCFLSRKFWLASAIHQKMVSPWFFGNSVERNQQLFD